MSHRRVAIERLSRTAWIRVLAVLAVSSFLACGGSDEVRDSSDRQSRAWVARAHSGGRQCDPREEYSAPDTRVELAAVDITVFETTERRNDVCMSCDCPVYSATHYALISASDVARAARAGFEPATHPDSTGASSSASAAASADSEGMPPLPTDRDVVYVCDTPEGQSFAFIVRPGPDEVGITLPRRFGGRQLVLPRVRAASGAKFEEGDVLLWMHGSRVRLDVDGRTCTCSERPPEEIVPNDDALSFRAIGQEPGWMLKLASGKWMYFNYDYGEREVFTPLPAPEVDDGRTVYHADTEAHDLLVVIEDGPCTDVMSGETFESTVTVTLDGKTYSGCGEPPR